MKSIIIAVALIAAVSSVKADCTLTLALKKASAKTYYLNNGERLSKTMVDRIKSQCAIKTRVMTKSQAKQLKIKELEIKLAKARQ